MRAEYATREDVPSIADVVREHERARWLRDRRFARPRTIDAIRRSVRTSLTEGNAVHLAVRDAAGSIIGYGAPRVQRLDSDNEWLAWAPRVGGVWDSIAVSPPGSPGRSLILSALVARARELWSREGLDGEVLAWASADGELAPSLASLGLIPSRHYALAFGSRGARAPTGTASYRPARLEEYPSLWRLRLEQAEFHVQHGRFDRPAPGLEQGFRRQFEAAFAAREVGEGLPRFWVAERVGAVVGFVEAAVQSMGDDNPRGLPGGRYGYINNAAVKGSVRGLGIGRGLMEYALGRLSESRVRAFVLWYAADNPLSSRFWPRMGFRDLITRYELRYDPTAGRAAESATTGGTESDP